MTHVRAMWVAAAAGSLLVIGGAGMQPPSQPDRPANPDRPSTQPDRNPDRERRLDNRMDDSVMNFDKDTAGKAPAGWRVATGKETRPGDPGLAPRKPGEPDLPGGPGPDKPGAPEEKPTIPQKPGEQPAERPGDNKHPDRPATPGIKSGWVVTADPTAPSAPNVLQLTAPTTNINGYNLIMCERHTLKDVDLTTKLRGDMGAQNQGGGLAWRIRNADNFYACSYSPNDGKLRVFKVADGRPMELSSADFKGSGPGASTWYTLGARMSGDTITCSINGQELLNTKDTTIRDSGKIGLWTKGDAASSFDDVNVKPGAGDMTRPDRPDKDNKPMNPPKEPDKRPGGGGN